MILDEKMNDGKCRIGSQLIKMAVGWLINKTIIFTFVIVTSFVSTVALNIFKY